MIRSSYIPQSPRPDKTGCRSGVIGKVRFIDMIGSGSGDNVACMETWADMTNSILFTKP